jgi:hypothetical protein
MDSGKNKTNITMNTYFENEAELYHVNSLCKEFHITNYTINADYSIDVNNHVDISFRDLTKLPITFNKVSGDFNCSNNHLSSLEGCPTEVVGDFICSYNKLTTLEWCPKVVGHNFHCNNNELTSLEHCPKEVNNNLMCHNNRIDSFTHSPNKIKGAFYCSDNDLSSLFGCPKVGETFDCSNNKISPIYYQIYNSLQWEDRVIFTIFQGYYDVWEPDFNETNALALVEDIKDGLR